MKQVYELTGSMKGIQIDTELVFPNVQTCIAVIGASKGTLIGAHVTLADRTRLSKVAELVKQQGNLTEVYVIGPVTKEYNVSSFANFGVKVHLCDIPGFIDIRAHRTGGRIRFYTRPTGQENWTELPNTSFKVGSPDSSQ